MNRLLVAFYVVMLFGCGPSEKDVATQKKIRAEAERKEKEFYSRGPVVVSELRTADGILQTIEIPVKDSVPMLKRCVLFVALSGTQSLTCEEPTFADLN